MQIRDVFFFLKLDDNRALMFKRIILLVGISGPRPWSFFKEDYTYVYNTVIVFLPRMLVVMLNLNNMMTGDIFYCISEFTQKGIAN